MYHINNEGKILPCKATVRACPYGADRHAKSKEELLYRLMQYQGQGEPSYRCMKQVNSIGRLMSLHPLSPDIVKSDSPVSTIVSSLSWAI